MWLDCTAITSLESWWHWGYVTGLDGRGLYIVVGVAGVVNHCINPEDLIDIGWVPCAIVREHPVWYTLLKNDIMRSEDPSCVALK